MIAIFSSFQVNCQTKISSDGLTKDIKGNIVLVGVEHSGGGLYEERKDGKGYQKSSLISDSSGMYLCSIYPEIIKISKGKRIIFMMEGLRPLKVIELDSATIRELRFPKCMQGDTMYGCDTRPDSIKIEISVVMSLLDPLYNDGIDGSEKTFEEALGKYSTVDLRKLELGDVQYFNYWSKVAGAQNRNFEDYILKVSRSLEQDGYFVVVVCGAAHVAKMIAKEPKKDIGYVLCINSKSIIPNFRLAKVLMVLEMFANKK